MERTELKDMIQKDPRKILDILKKGTERGVVEELWSVAMDEGEPKPVRKAIKKALYIVKSNGIDIDIYRPEPDEETIEIKDESAVQSVMTSIPDPGGHNVLVFAVAGSGGTGFDILRFLIGTDGSILKFSTDRGSKKHFEKFKAENPAFFPLPADYGLLRLKMALEKTEIKKVSGLSALPEALVIKEQKEVRHPVYDFVQVSVSRIVNPEDERNLFKLGEIGGLALPENDIEVFKIEIEAAKQSRLIVMGKSPEERVKAVIAKVYSVYFNTERRAVYRDMLLDIGLYFYYNGHAEYSRILIGWADRLLSVNLKAADHPFLSYLVYKAFMLK